MTEAIVLADVKPAMEALFQAAMEAQRAVVSMHGALAYWRAFGEREARR